ncbi:hypothetical protein Lal_00041355 [Lupinus albus]|nr:hypothetical protein Lal_00041355 [Lupinus albus]
MACYPERFGVHFGGAHTGAAWLSSARVVRCWVKSRNERNPRPQLPSLSWALWGDCRGKRTREGEQISKSRLSSDCTLQLECMKAESLVIVDQHATVNTFPGLVHTARHTMGVGLTRRRCADLAIGSRRPR